MCVTHLSSHLVPPLSLTLSIIIPMERLWERFTQGQWDWQGLGWDETR